MNQFEVSRLFEALGQTKTANEVRHAIKVVGADADGKIGFVEFLQMMAGPPVNHVVPEPLKNEAPSAPLGRAATTGLNSKALFFEQQLHSAGRQVLVGS